MTNDDSVPARYFVQAFGDENIVFSTDFPHADARFPHAVDSLLGLPLSDTTKRKVLWDNPARLYGIAVPPNRGAAGSSVLSPLVGEG